MVHLGILGVVPETFFPIYYNKTKNNNIIKKNIPSAEYFKNISLNQYHTFFLYHLSVYPKFAKTFNLFLKTFFFLLCCSSSCCCLDNFSFSRCCVFFSVIIIMFFFFFLFLTTFCEIYNYRST